MKGRATFATILEERAQRTPDRTAYVFLDTDGAEELTLTYAALWKRVCDLRSVLDTRCQPGDRALLVYPTGPDFITAFFACISSGVVAVPVYPPHPARFEHSMQKLCAIAEDAATTVLLTNTMIAEAGAELAQSHEVLGKMRWLATDALAPEGAGGGAAPERQTELCFLQYTSGSTGRPKGVMVSHRHLLENEATIQRAFRLSERSVVVSWLPLYHDMGLIGFALQPVFAGFPAVLMAPHAFLQRPITWLEAITRHRGTISGGPNFAYDLCVRRVREEDKARLDLSTWTEALNGAEPVRSSSLEAFSRAFQPARFRRSAFHPCYGMAEATLLVSGYKAVAPHHELQVFASGLAANKVEFAPQGMRNVTTLVSTGAALDWQLKVVEPESRTALGSGDVGEIWLAGPSVTGGYWRNPVATEATFGARLADGSGPWLRTGDLGFVHEGELYITGRSKDLIIIAGRNLYPQDIEHTVGGVHPAIRPGCVAAFPVERLGAEQLVLVVELERRTRDRTRTEAGDAPARPEVDPKQVVAEIRKAVALTHEVHASEVVLVKPGQLPKTSSGKLQRRACRALFEEGGFGTAIIPTS